MTFDELLKIDLNEKQQRLKELETVRLANADLQPEGTCPECQCVSGFLIIGHTMFNFCIEHRCYWRAGRSRIDHKDEQQAKWDEIGMDSFEEVRGWVTGMRQSAENS